MKYFKDDKGTVYAYEADGSQDAWIKPGLLPMSDEEVQVHLNPPLSLTPEEIKAKTLERIAERRWQEETGGLTLDGFFINTEDRSKLLLNGSALKAARNPDYTLRWKTPDGFIDLPAAQVLVIADAVADFVQACFDREDELSIAVEADTFTEDQLDQGWPNDEVPQQTPN